MAITNISPAPNAEIRNDDPLSFDIDNTYTFIQVRIETTEGVEYAYDSTLGGAQGGYQISITEDAGKQSWSITRDFGWNTSPFFIEVTENEAGFANEVTTTSYSLTSLQTFPEGTAPYFRDPLVDVTQHGNLGGLGNDDHTQYVLDTGTREQAAALFGERADHVNTPATGKGELWLRDDSRIVLTDEAGTDNTLAYTSEITGVVTAREILWEWNGTDTSQFGPIVVRNISGGNPGTVGGFVSTDTAAVSPQVGGTRLWFGSTGSPVSGDTYVILPINVQLPQQYEVEINSDFITSSININRGWCFYTMGDQLVNHGYLWHSGGRRARIDNGVVQAGGTQGTVGAGASGQMTLRVEGRPAPFVDYAHFQHLVEYKYATTQVQDIQRNAFDASDGDWAIGSLPPASWNGTSGDRFGLAILPMSSAPDWYINSIKIWKIG